MATNIRKNVFISYRVKDTQLATGRLVDALKQHIHENQIFMDIDKIDPGLDFTQVISKYLYTSEVLLAIIGPDWRAYNAEKGTYRINDPNDWVRKEIATALQRNIRVIPVLMDGASMPNEEDLPDDLKPLLLRQSYEISNKRWKYDCDQLIEILRKTMGETAPIEPRNNHTEKTSGKNNKTLWIIAAAAVFLLVIFRLSKNSSADEPLKPSPTIDSSASITPSSNKPSVNSQTATEVINIAGQWTETSSNEQYYFEQNNQQLSFTGSDAGQTNQFVGTGYINGNDVLIQILSVNGIAMPIPTKIDLKLSADGRNMNGVCKMENNGAEYTQKLYLKRN